MIRASFLFALAFLMLLMPAYSVLAQRRSDEVKEAEQREHRLTEIESRMASVAADIREIKDSHKYEIWHSLATGAIAALSGLQAVRTRKRKE